MEINNELKQVVAKTFGLPVAEVTPDLAAGSINKWDSLGHLNLVLAIESSFNVKFKTEQIAELITIRKIHEELKINGLF